MESDDRAEMAQVNYRNNCLEIKDLRIKERDKSLSLFCQMGKNALRFPDLALIPILSILAPNVLPVRYRASLFILQG